MNNRWLIFTLFCTAASVSIDVGHRGAQVKSNSSTSMNLIVVLPVKRRLGGDGCSSSSGGESRILNPSKLWLIGMSTIQLHLLCILFVSHQSTASVLQYDQTGKGQANRCGGRSRRHPYRLAENIPISPGSRRHSSKNAVIPESHRLDAVVDRRRWIDHREFGVAVRHGCFCLLARKSANGPSRYRGSETSRTRGKIEFEPQCSTSIGQHHQRSIQQQATAPMEGRGRRKEHMT